MIKRALFALLLVFVGSAAAHAACAPLPYNLTNGTVADANQVMANFNSLLSCASASGSTQVQTNAQLKALAGAVGLTVFRAGFSAAGDAGEGMTYNFQAANCSISGGDNGSQVQPNSGTGCWIWSPGPDVDLRTFGGNICNGSTDNTPILLAAYNALPALGGTIVFPVGVCNFNSTETLSNGGGYGKCLTLIGQGSGGNNVSTRGTYLNFVGVSGDGLLLQQACLNMRDLNIIGGAINGPTTMAATSVLFKLYGPTGACVYHAHIERVSVYHFANGFLGLGCIQTVDFNDFVVTYADLKTANMTGRGDVVANSCPTGCVALFQGSDTASVQGINCAYCSFLAGTPSGATVPVAAGLVLDGAVCSNTFAPALYVSFNNNPVWIKSDTGLTTHTYNPCYTYFGDGMTMEAGSAQAPSVLIAAGNEIHITGAEVSGGNVGISVGQIALGGVHIDNTLVRANGDDGIRCASQCTLTGNVVEANGLAMYGGDTTGVTAVTNSGGLIEIAYNNTGWTGLAPTLQTGSRVTISGTCVGGANVTRNPIIVIDSTHFTLNGSTFVSGCGAGGTLSGNAAAAVFAGTAVEATLTGGLYGSNGVETNETDYGVLTYNPAAGSALAFVAPGNLVGPYSNASSSFEVVDSLSGVVCSGSPSGSFATVAGVVTHC